jgi:CRISPR-associated protein Csy1
MFTSHHEAVTSTFAVRLHQAFQRRHIDLHDRTVFMSGQLTHQDYLRLNELCDVMLDTVHWSGGNTSLDALASGLPIVTLPGHLMRGRQSQAMLRGVGVPELIAKDADDYVARAVNLGRDREMRRSLSARILANREALFERDEPVRALERFLEDAAG